MVQIVADCLPKTVLALRIPELEQAVICVQQDFFRDLLPAVLRKSARRRTGHGKIVAERHLFREAPELRPAQERLAKRSRPGRAAKAAPAPSADGGEDAGTPPKGEPSKEEAPGEEKPETRQGQPEQEPKPTDPAEKRKAFGQLMQGEYAAEFEEALQRASEMAVQNVLDNPAVKGLMDALGEAYGIDVQSADNLAALTEAVKNGKVKNDEYYETLAAERGISVKTAREMDRMESELQRANAEKQRAEQIRQAAEHQQRAAAVRAQWEAEAAQLKVKYPAFELDEVLNNPSVADMIRRI